MNHVALDSRRPRLRSERQPSRRGSRCPRGAVGRLRGALRAFLRGEHGAVAIETAFATVVLVTALGMVMGIVSTTLTDDRSARAARAAARALALDPTADPCAAIRRELSLADDFDCATEWTIEPVLGVGPDALPDTLCASATPGTGDLVLVRLGPSGLCSDDDDEGDADDDATDFVAIGLARCEAELCGQETS